MKKITVFSLFILLFSVGYSQTFPLPGATWMFVLGFNPWIDEGLEKWEYMGNGTMRVTTKYLNRFTYVGVEEIVNYRHISVSGDVFSIDGFPIPIADFSLQIGDSSYTPYYGSGWSDSCLIQFTNQKGVVTEIGTETQDGITSRYYILTFLGEIGGNQTVKFSERSLITVGYWQWDAWPIFCSLPPNEGSSFGLVCYYDDLSASLCPNTLYWFDHMDVDNIDAASAIQIYPNPVMDVLKINSPSDKILTVYVTDMHGRKVKDVGTVLSTDGIDVQDLRPGMYTLHYAIVGGKWYKEKFVKK